jgi:hypothetical protein
MSILEQALADVTERLRDRPPTRETAALTELARRYQAEYASWAASIPDEAERAALVKAVLDLNVLVIRGSARAGAKD